MAEQPATTTQQRPAIYTVATGNQLKGATVEILGSDKPLEALRPNDKVWVREFTQFPRPEQTLREATIGWRNLERTYRTPNERELGRDFTGDEAMEHDRTLRLRVAQHRVEYARKEIVESIEKMAERLARSAEELRRTAASDYEVAQKVYYTQHELAWLFPNLGADVLTNRLVEWVQMDAEIKRLGGTSEADAES